MTHKQCHHRVPQMSLPVLAFGHRCARSASEKAKGKLTPGWGWSTKFGCRFAQAVKARVSKICPREEAWIEEDPEALESWLRGIKQ